jgi:ATP-dependent DNA helicase MPH1
MIPDRIKTECLEKVMEIRPYVRQEGKRKNSSKTSESTQRATKRKRDPNKNIPPGASTGFVSVAELIARPVKKQRKLADLPEDAGEDDDVDRDIEEENFCAPIRRTATSTASTKTTAKKGPLRKTVSETQSKVSKGRKKAIDLPALTSSQFSAQGVDDSDDLAIENGLESLISQAKHAEKEEDMVIDIPDESSPRPSQKPSSPNPAKKPAMNWLDSDDDNPRRSPAGSKPRSYSFTEDDSVQILNPLSTSKVAFELDDEESEVEIVEQERLPTKGSTGFASAKDLLVEQQRQTDGVMDEPDASFAIARPRGRRLAVVPESPEVSSPDTCRRRRRLKRGNHSDREDAGEEQHKAKSTKAREKKEKLSAKHIALFDYAAEHSGDEVSEGSSGPDTDEDVLSEVDRAFINDGSFTQASPSYDQTLAYRQSLFTQAPDSSFKFAQKPARRGVLGGGGRTESSRRRPGALPSSSPDSRPNDYELGTFVVDDDAEISYEVDADRSSEL